MVTPGSCYGIRMFRKLAIVNVSNRCNHTCVFCSEGERHDGTVTPLETVDRLLADLARRGHDAVNFMGGETTLRKDVVELVQRVRDHGLRASLTTNGVRFSSVEFADRIVPLLANIEVSLPAADPQTYAAITRSDHLDRVLAGLANIGRAARAAADPAHVVVNTVVCRLNATAPAAVTRRLAGLDLGPRPLLHFIRARPKGRASGGELALGLPETVASFAAGVAAARRAGLPAMFRGLPMCCPIDEVAHNFWALEAVARPDNTYLNRQPLCGDPAETPNRVDEAARLDRRGLRYLPACTGCGLRPVCPGIPHETPDDPLIRPPDPCPSHEELYAAVRSGPVANLVLDP